MKNETIQNRKAQKGYIHLIWIPAPSKRKRYTPKNSRVCLHFSVLFAFHRLSPRIECIYPCILLAKFKLMI